MERNPKHTPPTEADQKAALYMALMCAKNVMRSVGARLGAGDLDPATVDSLVGTLNREADHDEQVLAENDSLRLPSLGRAA